MNAKQTLVAAAICGALAVLIGAFGAHGLPGYLTAQNLSSEQQARQLNNLEVGARYHMYHALALALVGVWLRSNSLAASMVGPLFLLGLVLFSGCLYLYAVWGLKSVQMLVPVGGLCFVVGWFIWAVQIARQNA